MRIKAVNVIILTCTIFAIIIIHQFVFARLLSEHSYYMLASLFSSMLIAYVIFYYLFVFSLSILRELEAFYLKNINNKAIVSRKWYFSILEKYSKAKFRLILLYLLPFAVIANFYYLNNDLREIKIAKFRFHPNALMPLCWIMFSFGTAIVLLPLITAINILKYEKDIQNIFRRNEKLIIEIVPDKKAVV